MRASILLLVLSSVCGCAAGGVGDGAADGLDGKADEAAATRFPGAEWERAAPTDVGLDPAALAAADEYAASVGGRCLVIVKGGRVVHESYFGPNRAGETVRTWSVAKSYASILVGIAIQERMIDSVDDPVWWYLPDWLENGRDHVTIRHLLSMTSGVGTGSTSEGWWVASTWYESDSAETSTLADAPGAKWSYSNRAVQVLEPLLRAATGMSTLDFARRYLFEPLGMSPATSWETDSGGSPTMYANVQASCLDHARLGHLVLRGGAWRDRQLVSPWYLSEATSPSQDLNRAYGYLFWLNGELPHINSVDDPMTDVMFPFAPQDMITAKGVGNSFIDIIPSEDMVIVFARPAPQEDLFGHWPWTTVALMRETALNREHGEILRRLFGEW